MANKKMDDFEKNIRQLVQEVIQDMNLYPCKRGDPF